MVFKVGGDIIDHAVRDEPAVAHGAVPLDLVPGEDVLHITNQSMNTCEE